MVLSMICMFGVFNVADAVINGTAAELDEFPYQVSLQTKMGHICGGSVISSNYVLTAAHCVEEKVASEVYVVVGTINKQNYRNVHAVDKIIVHENYNPGDSWRNDIALLKVKTPFKLGKNIAVVPLPKENEVVPAKSPAVVSGWGRINYMGDFPEILQKATIQISEQSVCKNAYEGVTAIYETHICAHDPSEIRGACN
ncbi:fibrinolytic enzyme, isozyme C-like, partial [Augochlora pura]